MGFLVIYQVKEGMDDRPILQYVHGLYHDLGVQELTVQTDYAWSHLDWICYYRIWRKAYRINYFYLSINCTQILTKTLILYFF